jgi:hypothetical protein
LPANDGTYSVSFAGALSVEDTVIGIYPINAESGDPALASQSAVAGLRHSSKVNGVVLVVTPSGCRIVRPATNKGASKTWDEYLCDSAAVVKTEGRGYSLVCVFGDGNARAFSIPGLKEIGCGAVNKVLDVRRLSDALISPTGDIVGWVGPSQIAVLNVWGAGEVMYVSTGLEGGKQC